MTDKEFARDFLPKAVSWSLEKKILALMIIRGRLAPWEREFVVSSHRNFYANGQFTDRWAAKINNIFYKRCVQPLQPGKPKSKRGFFSPPFKRYSEVKTSDKEALKDGVFVM